MRHLLLTLVLVLIGFWGQAQTTINGKVTDEKTGEELIGANVVLYQSGTYRFGSSTDFNGNYRMNVDPGTYEMKVSYVGYSTSSISGVLINASQENRIDVTLGGGKNAVDIPVVVFKTYRKPLINQGGASTGAVVTSKEIRQLSTKNVTALATQIAGASAVDEGDAVTIKGARSAGTNYYIDGIRVSGAQALIPESEIEQLHVITGGIDAMYGDVTGGIISITTKGPSNKFSGGLELETSEYLDQFGYNMINANISGPILKRKDSDESLIGFRFSGRYRSLKDNDPPATDIYQVKDEVLAELEANPILSFGTGGQVPAGQFITNDDVRVLGYQPNEQEERLDLTGKLEGRIGDNMDLTLSGSFSDRRDRFTPGENLQTGNNWRVFNSHNNPYQNDVRYRGNFRIRHRLGKTAATDSDAKAKIKTPLVSNIEYSIIGGYEKQKYDRADHRHGANLFDYGYVGKFDYQWDPAFEYVSVEGRTTVAHVDYTQNFIGFTPGTQNPVLANYNNNAEPGNINSYVADNESFSGGSDEIWDNHTNVGQVYNFYQKTENDLLTLNVSSNFDISPGGSDKGTHSIQFGILYEQRINRGFDILPNELWQIARQQSNRNILGIDPTDTIGWVNPGLPWSTVQDSVAIHPVIAVNEPGLNFSNSIRQLLGAQNNEYVNVHALSPDQLSLDMFSAKELNDQFQLIDLNYYGFDHTGRKLSNNVTFNDFFTSTVSDTDITRTFPVAAVRPNYAAAYIQDRFTYKDIVFRLGLRVDRFDANTKVLKDPYSLYEVMTAQDFFTPENGQPRPEGVEDDYRVYVADRDSDKVIGYRRGDQWYNEQGEPVNDGRLIFGGNVVTPKLYENRVNNIQHREFDPNNSFEDYEPQVNWMPRLAFSFPISKVANFFAHYDILVQRPTANGINTSRATALDYFYWEKDANARLPNANLKPQRTIDYQVGFQQKLTNASAIKLSVFYREMRDMIQGRNYLFVPGVSSYETYGNIDFGTSKGFTLQYDLRRTRNVTFNGSYSLQFADGTGSDANDRRGITNRGVIRNLFPLNFDERHRIIGTIDYRYSSGSEYNGPRVNGKDVLENFGVNLQTIAVSGRPYTAKQQAKPLDADGTKGQVNGSRLPWNYTLHLRIDKTFRLSKAKAETPLGLNVYFRVQNLLDTRNIVNVYPLTGAPDDDGYLTSTPGIQKQNDIRNSGLDLQSYVDAYQWRVLNPNFFSLPRRMYLGAILEF